MPRQSPDLVVKLYEQAKTLRASHEDEWRKAAAYCLPSQYSSWQTDGPATFHQKNVAVRRIAYDTTGTRSLPKYVSILERIATPVGQKWHKLMPSDTTLQKKRRVRMYFDELNNILFKYRYNPKARFRIASNEVYGSMGVYGTGPLYIGERKTSMRSAQPGFKYIACPMRDIFFLVDDEGETYAVFRRFWLNLRQFKTKFPGEPLPPCLQQEEKKPLPDETAFFEFVHYCTYRDAADYDPDALDVRRHPVSGSYVAIKDASYVGEETGYLSMPYKMARTMTVAGDPYGISPAVMSLAALGGASQIKKTNLKQGNKIVDPPLLAYDDNTANGEVNQTPGAVNYGGISRNGQELIKPLRGGDLRVSEVLLQDERADIEDCFFVTLFSILTEHQEMTATEVMERVGKEAALLSPTMGRLQSEQLGPQIEREIDILAEMGRLPEMPPELVEAEGEYEVVYTSPMAKAMYAEEVSGFMRAVEMALNVAAQTQDPAPIDHFNFDDAIPEISNYMAVPERWINAPDKVSEMRQGRQEAMQREQVMQNAPALASAAKTASEMGQG